MSGTGSRPSSTPPPLNTPPEETVFQRLRLLRSRRVGIATYHRLMAEHGSAAAALDALPEIARGAGMARYSVCPEGVVAAEMAAGAAAGARLIGLDDPAYPPALAQIEDAPPFLWVRGRTELLARPCLALVGARNASSVGTRMAQGLARDLGAAGYVIVSGLARGIDAAAHRIALDNGTVAVLAGGVDVLYPAENAGLGAEIAQQGLLVSEQPMGLQPMARHFPARNRIISGLAEATVVVEAAAKSGSLITARGALDQGREVLAVPGNPFDARAAGCNLLIRDGATLVRGAEDVMEALRPLAPRPRPSTMPAPVPAPPQPTRSRAAIAALHSDILGRLGPSPVAEDQLIRDLGLPAGDIGPVLVELEMEGRIDRQPGGLLSRLN
ncbi:MAG: DNA-processing protein DprA [Pseudomonadota bacterium]